jgi:hypothetical protein
MREQAYGAHYKGYVIREVLCKEKIFELRTGLMRRKWAAFQMREWQVQRP